VHDEGCRPWPCGELADERQVRDGLARQAARGSQRVVQMAVPLAVIDPDRHGSARSPPCVLENRGEVARVVDRQDEASSEHAAGLAQVAVPVLRDDVVECRLRGPEPSLKLEVERLVLWVSGPIRESLAVHDRHSDSVTGASREHRARRDATRQCPVRPLA
jgi:hypothetical protein